MSDDKAKAAYHDGAPSYRRRVNDTEPKKTPLWRGVVGEAAGLLVWVAFLLLMAGLSAWLSRAGFEILGFDPSFSDRFEVMVAVCVVAALLQIFLRYAGDIRYDTADKIKEAKRK